MAIPTSNIVVGVGAAIVATILAPVLIPVLSTTGRPLAKSLIKGGMLLYEKSREALAVAGEVTEDLMAEIRAEEASRRVAAEAGTEGGTSEAGTAGAGGAAADGARTTPRDYGMAA